MPSFDSNIGTQVINPFTAFYDSGRQSTAIDTAQQNLADRAALRGLAPDLGSTDPAVSGPAQATAATLSAPGVGGDSTASNLTSMHADQRAALNQTLNVTGAVSGAILNSPPEQRAALWSQLRPVMVQAGAVKTPVDYPGDDYLTTHRTAALTVQQQIEAMANIPTGDPYRTGISPPSGPRVGPGGAVQGQDGTPGASPAPQPRATIGGIVRGPAPAGGYGGEPNPLLGGLTSDGISGASAPASVQTAGPGAPPAPPDQNGLMPLMSPDGAAPPRAPPNPLAGPGPQAGPQLMPSASAQPPASTGGAQGQPQTAPTRALAPGETPLYLPGKGPMPGRTPGYQMTRLPDGSYSQIRMPGTPPNIEYQKTEDQIVGIDKDTNQVVSRVPITSAARVQMVPAIDPATGKAGTQATQNGQPVGPVYPGTGSEAQAAAYKSDAADMKDSGNLAATAQNNMPRLNEMADLIPLVATGGLLPELRAKVSGILQGLGYTPDVMNSFVGLSNGAQAQLLTKLAVSTASAAAKENTGANTGIESTRLSMSANPGMGLLPDANLRVTNMMRVQNQALQDYNQAAQEHFAGQEDSHMKGGQYEPMTKFNRQWQAQNNPQVYFGATSILNGDKFEDWSSRLKSPAEIARAQEIAQRIDPNVTIPQKGGGPISRLAPSSGPIVTSAAQHQSIAPGTTYVDPDGNTRLRR